MKASKQQKGLTPPEPIEPNAMERMTAFRFAEAQRLDGEQRDRMAMTLAEYRAWLLADFTKGQHKRGGA